MNSPENKIISGSKPVIYSIAAAFILLFASLIFQQSENPLAHFFANIYLFPFHLEFSKSISVFIAALISSGIAFLLYIIFSWNIKTKFGFYIVGTFLAYFVYTGAWLFVKTMGFAVQDIIRIDKIIPGIILLLVSILFIFILCSVHFSLAKEVYETGFLEDSEVYQANKRLENINNHKRKMHEQVQESRDRSRTIFRISDQEGITNLYKGLEKVEQLINMGLTSDAAFNLRLVSELLTKQISNHNKLGLEKMDQYSRVQSLYDQKYITDELYHLLTTIRKLGNTAVHEFGDDDRFNKNGLLKLRRQFLDHLREWIKNDQNEVAAAVDDGNAEEYDDQDDEYENIDEDVEQDDGYEKEYDDQDDEDENAEEDDDQDTKYGVEDEEKPQRYSFSMNVPKEKREKMKF
jgi:hypothetical protein